MKKIILYIAAVCCLSSTGCSFLDERSQDEVRPSTVDDLVQLMLGEGYSMSNDFLNYFDHLSDDVKSQYPDPTLSPGGDLSLTNYKAMYLWDPNMYDIAKENKLSNYNHWEYLYQRIMGCNVVLSMIDEVLGGHEARENLRGQALAMRGFYYFTLVNIYSMPYTSGNPNDIMGVPIITEPQLIDSYPPRASLYAVYDQIIKDLTEAYPLLNQYGQNNMAYRATDKFANALLSRIYLYMEDWSKSIEFANYVIEKYPSLQNLSNHIELTEDPWGYDDPTVTYNFRANVYSHNSVEMLWGYSRSFDTNDMFPTTLPSGEPAWSISDELMSLYSDDESGAKDLRVNFYIVNYLFGYIFDPEFVVFMKPLYMDKGDRTRGACQGMRTSEVYLNRAEANIMLAIDGKGGDITQALSDINTLREARFNTKEKSYTPWTTSDPQELLKMYREERRRELAFEKHRWFDLRRWGITGFSHTIEQIKGVKQTAVFDNPKMYALPIPQIVIDLNPSIKPNVY